jgi:hypothetical protein
MGIRNVLAAYDIAGKVPPLSMQVLIYMAARSIDGPAPWFTGGYRRLAVEALKRGTDKADLLAVKRALQPLRDLGVVVTDQRAANRQDNPTARYRLCLPTGSLDTESQGSDFDPRLTEKTETRVEKRADEGRFSIRRGSKNVPTRVENRPSKEEEEEEEKEEGPAPDPARASAPPRHCPKHINNPTDRPCGPCGDARRAHDTWDREHPKITPVPPAYTRDHTPGPSPASPETRARYHRGWRDITDGPGDTTAPPPAGDQDVA